jgi:hypothetical protein
VTAQVENSDESWEVRRERYLEGEVAKLKRRAVYGVLAFALVGFGLFQWAQNERTGREQIVRDISWECGQFYSRNPDGFSNKAGGDVLTELNLRNLCMEHVPKDQLDNAIASARWLNEHPGPPDPSTYQPGDAYCYLTDAETQRKYCPR